jgi:hypothetical protein
MAWRRQHAHAVGLRRGGVWAGGGSAHMWRGLDRRQWCARGRSRAETRAVVRRAARTRAYEEHEQDGIGRHGHGGDGRARLGDGCDGERRKKELSPHRQGMAGRPNLGRRLWIANKCHTLLLALQQEGEDEICTVNMIRIPNRLVVVFTANSAKR